MATQLSSKATQTLDSLRNIVSPSNTADEYDIHQLLGSGFYSKVYYANVKADQSKEVALKCQELNEKTLRPRAINEIKFLKSLKHEHLIDYKDSYITANTLVIVMEYVNGGDLSLLMKRYARKQIPMDIQLLAGLVQRMGSGLAFMHAAGVVHRDIKPANVLVSKSGHVKIADLGFAREERLCKDYYGTQGYRAPEMYIGLRYDRSVDIYSLGMTIMALWNGQIPYRGLSREIVIQRTIAGELPPFSYVDIVPQELQSLFCSCTQMEPKARLTADAILTHFLVQEFNLNQHEMALAIAALLEEPSRRVKP